MEHDLTRGNVLKTIAVFALPYMLSYFLQMLYGMADLYMMGQFSGAAGITADREKMAHNLHNSLMLVTALNPDIGYENAAKVAKKAYRDGVSLKEACVELGFLTAEKFDEVFHPEQMV